MIREYINNVNATQDTWYAQDPYYYVRIDSIDHSSGSIQKYGFDSFIPGDFVATDRQSKNNFSWISLKPDIADTYLSLQRTITLPADAYYLIEIMIEKGPTVDTTTALSMSINGTSVWEESGYAKWKDYGTVIRLPIQFLDSGANTFTLYLPKHARAGWFKISKLTRYEGGKDLINDSETRLDLISAEFSQNGINELDMMDITIAMKDDFYTDEMGNNPMCFDMGDHITLVLGQDSVEARPMFGGYVAGWSLSDDRKELTLTCVDRLWDLKRTMIYTNFSIGAIPKDDGSGSMPFKPFTNVNEIAKYLANAMYRINYDSVVRDYIFLNSFGLENDAALPVSGFEVSWDTDFGHPAPCMKIIPTKIGSNSVTLYNSSSGEWDAADHNIFGFDYYVGGAGIKYPIRFNVEIDMYSEEDLISSALTYTINFNGTSPIYVNTVIGSVTPIFNGEWQKFSIDLKAAFDKFKPSSSYYIKEIRLVGEQPNQTVLDRRCSTIYIDHIIGLRYLNQAPAYKSADCKNAFEELNQLCEGTGQVAYIRPGMERSEDSLIMIPKLFYTIPVEINNKNVMSVSNMEYKPLEWGMVNWAADTFKDAKQNSQNSNWVDDEAEKHYGIIQDHEFFSDITTLSQATILSRSKVALNAWQYIGFGVTLRGSTLFEPGQYVNVKLPEYHILGAYEIQSIVHKMDFVHEDFVTELDFGRPSGTFSNLIKTMRRNQREIKNVRNNSAYASGGALAAGMETALGAYDV